MITTLSPLQSVTVPLQGFLNAIIYGRTREDFVHMMGTTGRFFAAPVEDDSSAIHVIRYNSEYSDGDSGESSELKGKKSGLISSESFSDCPTPLLNSGN